MSSAFRGLPLVPIAIMSSNSTVSNLPDLPTVPSLDNTFGAVLIGTFIGLMYVAAQHEYNPQSPDWLPTASMG